ncbi:MAG: hypothetical protein AAGB11_00440 [Pseudomonadota bacterium]
MKPLSGQADIERLAQTQLPPGVKQHPGMLCANERAFLYNCIPTEYIAGTAIVDAGAFLGASTRAFSEALRKLGVEGETIHSYEHAIFNGNTARVAKMLLKEEFSPDGRFDKILLDQLSDVDDLICFHIGDICQESEPFDSQISILFLDVIKNSSISTKVRNLFFPKLISNQSIIIHQDYYHPQHTWIQYVMGAHKNCFEYLGRPEKPKRLNTAVFRAKSIDSDEFVRVKLEYGVDRDLDLARMDDAVAMHKDPLEKLLVLGSRACVLSWFEKNAERATKDYYEQLERFGAHHFVSDPEQEFHIKRVERAIFLYGTGRRSFA